MPSILGLIGCSQKDPDRYYNGKNNFSKKFPKDWGIKEGFMNTEVIALQPIENEEDDFRENVNVVIEKLPQNINIDEYLNLNIINLNKFFANYNEVERGKTYLEDEEARWLIYSGQMGNYDLKYLVYVAIRKKSAYIITCTSIPEKFDNNRNLFEQISKSIEFD